MYRIIHVLILKNSVFTICIMCFIIKILSWYNWLRHCATNWRLVGSIPSGVIGIFHRHNPSNHPVALGSTQLLTEMSTRGISWCITAAGAQSNLPTFMFQLSRNSGSVNLLDPKALFRPVMG
jgi:hypothetical protein